jgi:integrase/recombinase XerD
MSPLRQQMIDELRRRNYSDVTVRTYVRAVASFSAHCGRSPARLGADDVRRWQMHLVDEKKVSWSTYNVYSAGLRFFYAKVLKQEDIVKEIACARKPKRLPTVLSQAELVQLFEATTNLRDRVLLTTAYACGLRVNEVACLQVDDIDSKRMLVHVRQGKGNKERIVPLPPALLDALRRWWLVFRPARWLFSGRDRAKPITARAIRHAVTAAAVRAGLKKRVSPHTLRHSFATHLVEMGTSLHTVQVLLGHNSFKTTTRYNHVARPVVTATKSPYDLIGA